MLFALSLLWACSTEVEVRRHAVEVDCFTYPDSPQCSKKGFNLGFKILTKKFVTNAKDAKFEWESMGEGFSYELFTATDANCTDVIDVFAQDSTERKIGLLGNGRYYLCVYGLKRGARIAASNNPVPFTVDRNSPIIIAPTIGAGLTPSNVTQVPEITLADDTDLSLEWVQKSGPGSITFENKNELRTGLTASVDGTYGLLLNVIDQAGNTYEQNFQMNIDTTPPQVEAGEDISSTSLSAIIIGSYKGDATAFEWSMEGGPVGGVLTFEDPTVLSTNVTGGVSGKYIIKLTAKDPAGNTGSDTLTFSWYQSNNLPNIAPIADQKVNETKPITTIDANDISGGDYDLDGQTISWTCLYDFLVDGRVPLGKSCSTLDNASFDPKTGILNWTPTYLMSNGASRAAPAAKAYEFAIMGNDTEGTVAEIFTIYVQKTEADPLLTPIAKQNIAENSPLEIDAKDSNSDGDLDINGDQLSYPCRFDTEPDSYMALNSLDCSNISMGATFNRLTGIFSWTPDFEQAGRYEIEIAANDGFGASHATLFEIVVNNTNRNPDIASIADFTISEMEALPIIDATDKSGGDTDIDREELLYSCYWDNNVDGSVSRSKSCSQLRGRSPANFTGNGILSWTPGSREAGTYEIRLTAADGMGGFDDEIFVITVADRNMPPSLSPIGDQTVAENSSISTIDASDGETKRMD